ncbi:MAG: sensor histidine kinase [Epsilonproteobacteria bacterium]|nr:MAG: sensor histidine kinase [Campylobacterota bacterium]
MNYFEISSLFNALFIIIIILLVYKNRKLYLEIKRQKIDTEQTIYNELKKLQSKDKAIFNQVKLISMNEMIENIAHQWRQPLAQINSSVLVIDVIMDKSNFKNEKINSKLLEIESLTKYMSHTIDDFRLFFDKRKKKREFKLNETIDRSLSIIQTSLLANNITLKFSLDQDIVVNGYSNELQQVLLVLINNAKDALIIRKINMPTITITTLIIDKKVLISVCDNAKGIDKDIIDKIFDPYFTTKHKSQGTGLGLYISKMIIEHGGLGELSVTNSKKGACFKILLH